MDAYEYLCIYIVFLSLYMYTCIHTFQHSKINQAISKNINGYYGYIYL